MGHYHREVKCYIRVSRFFGNFIEDNAEAFDEAMSSFVFAESDKLGLLVDYFILAFFDKVSMCWCYFRPEVSWCGRSYIWGGVRVVCFTSTVVSGLACGVAAGGVLVSSCGAAARLRV